MKLISSGETLSFLTQSAPRAWIKRMLLWMIFSGELASIFKVGRIVPSIHVTFAIYGSSWLRQIRDSPDFDSMLRKYYGDRLADQITGRNDFDIAHEESVEWLKEDDVHAVGSGFFVYADEIDWDAGTLTAQLIGREYDKDHFPDAEEHLTSAFSNANYDAALSGLYFSLGLIEMLNPNVELGRSVQSATTSRPIGRPPKWDWEGAMAHLTARAQHPDGLPTSAGAQARIEQLISEWFIASSGDAPAPSMIRTCARAILAEIEKAIS